MLHDRKITVGSYSYRIRVVNGTIRIVDYTFGRCIFSLVIPQQYSAILLSCDEAKIVTSIVNNLPRMIKFVYPNGDVGDHILSVDNYHRNQYEPRVVEFFDNLLCSLYSRTKSALC